MLVPAVMITRGLGHAAHRISPLSRFSNTDVACNTRNTTLNTIKTSPSHLGPQGSQAERCSEANLSGVTNSADGLSVK